MASKFLCSANQGGNSGFSFDIKVANFERIRVISSTYEQNSCSFAKQVTERGQVPTPCIRRRNGPPIERLIYVSEKLNRFGGEPGFCGAHYVWTFCVAVRLAYRKNLPRFHTWLDTTLSYGPTIQKVFNLQVQ